MISCSCGSGFFNSLSAFVEPHSISATTTRAGAVSGSAVSMGSCKLQPLHPPPQGLAVASQAGQSWPEPSSLGQSSVAQHGASETCLLISHLTLLSYFISLSVKNHHQPACDLSVPETTRVWAGFFSILAFFTKMCQRHNLLQWNCEHTNQIWHLLTSNSFVSRRQEIKRQLIWANKTIFYVFLQSFRM